MKKLLKIALICLLIIAFVVGGYYLVLFYSHYKLLEAKEATVDYYSSYSVQSDGYTLKTKVYNTNEISSIGFMVEKDGKTVYDSEKEGYGWRAFDLKKIDFSKNSLDIIVESGDEGEFVFVYNGEVWELED
jgi:hypothetical protein